MLLYSPYPYQGNQKGDIIFVQIYERLCFMQPTQEQEEPCDRGTEILL